MHSPYCCYENLSSVNFLQLVIFLYQAMSFKCPCSGNTSPWPCPCPCELCPWPCPWPCGLWPWPCPWPCGLCPC